MSTPATFATSQNVVFPAIPELYDSNFLDLLVPRREAEVKEAGPAAQPSNPMMEALKSTTHRVRTTNNAPTFDSTLSATLDAFNMLRPQSLGSHIYRYLGKAWEEDPELTLRIIWNSRSIHDGKGEKEIFYQAWGWLYKNHPRTALENLPQLVKPLCSLHKGKDAAPHGYWKDLLNLLCLAALDQLGPLNKPSTYLHNYMPATSRRRWDNYSRKSKPKKAVTDLLGNKVEKAREATNEAKKAEARRKRENVNLRLHQNLLRKLSEPRFRALYILVARLFAAQLAEDVKLLDRIESLSAGEERNELIRQITLVSKWAPTPGRSHDRHTNIASAISQLLQHSYSIGPSRISVVPGQEVPSMETHVLRSYYQRWVLTALRKVIAVPEPLMSANRWKEIIYSRVSSQCMKNNMTRFYEHDPEGFEKYMMRVESGSRKISGATLMPHELLIDAVACASDSQHVPNPARPTLRDIKKKQADMQLRVIEAQWRTMLDRVREARKMENALAVCDVSGSMGQIWPEYSWSGKSVLPIYPAIALSLVLAQIAKPPFSNAFITFSAHPEFVELDPSAGLVDAFSRIQRADCGMNTNYEAVFLKLLLPLAIKHNVKQEDMIKRLFVFSDMQFDESQKSDYSSSNPVDYAEGWDTNHDVIERAYRDAGYEVPEIVYWNLGFGSETIPVQHDRKGVAIMNGFSPAMMKVFMGEEEEAEDVVMEDEQWENIGADGEPEIKEKEKEEFNPLNVMKKALSKASYDGLVVVD
ncbi:unnamed protein product [Somion occarium]|uniref:Uncharacterized protein n=1 Tax=Somion occarium TaxID=3059160 RepID=A0ABP1DXK0_9APHY